MFFLQLGRFGQQGAVRPQALQIDDDGHDASGHSTVEARTTYICSVSEAAKTDIKFIERFRWTLTTFLETSYPRQRFVSPVRAFRCDPTRHQV